MTLDEQRRGALPVLYPIPTWQDGPVALMGDAAHPMYPTGSNGGSQAVVDARVLGAAIVEHGVTPEALAGAPADPRMDVFSCGVLLYQLLTGKLPVGGLDPLPPAIERVVT